MSISEIISNIAPRHASDNTEMVKVLISTSCNEKNRYQVVLVPKSVIEGAKYQVELLSALKETRDLSPIEQFLLHDNELLLEGAKVMKGGALPKFASLSSEDVLRMYSPIDTPVFKD